MSDTNKIPARIPRSRLIANYERQIKHWESMCANQCEEIELLGDEIAELKRTLSKSMYALQENDQRQQTSEALCHDNRELNRILDKAFDEGFESEWDT